ncbi:hypothetical protein BJX70DRAFT_393562 [Aspergillus crustosus]
MLIPASLLLVYAFCASESWVFGHDFDLTSRSWLSESSYDTRYDARYIRRDEEVSAAGGPGQGRPCRPRDRYCNPRPTTTTTTTKTTTKTTSTTTSTSTSTTTTHPTATPCAGSTPSTRRNWCNHSIDTYYHSITPFTGVTREYWLEIDEMIGAFNSFP